MLNSTMMPVDRDGACQVSPSTAEPKTDEPSSPTHSAQTHIVPHGQTKWVKWCLVKHMRSDASRLPSSVLLMSALYSLSHFTLTLMESVALLILFILDIYTTNALLSPAGKTFKQKQKCLLTLLLLFSLHISVPPPLSHPAPTPPISSGIAPSQGPKAWPLCYRDCVQCVPCCWKHISMLQALPLAFSHYLPVVFAQGWSRTVDMLA